MENETANPFEVLSYLLAESSAASARYMDARAAYVEHNQPVDLALAQHHAGSAVGAAILASQLSRVLEPELRMPYVDPEAKRIGRMGVQATQNCRVAAGHLILDLRRLTGLPLGDDDADCLAMMAEARKTAEGVL